MKHEKEIKYWAEHAEGTLVFYKKEGVEGEWETLHDKISWAPECEYIVDDEWAELRKAQVNGKKIQKLHKSDDLEGYNSLPDDWYKNGFYEDCKTASPKDYKIVDKWYNSIGIFGVFCALWDNKEDPYSFGIVINYDNFSPKPFFTTDYRAFKHAKPLTCKDIEKHILKES